MDRNTLFALALAILVLSLYQSIFVVPKHKQMLTNTQVTENKEVVSKNEVLSNSSPLKTENTTPNQKKEQLTKLQTTYMMVDFSNMGGSLHNVTMIGSAETFPIKNLFLNKGFEQESFILKDHTDRSVTYEFADAQHKITKSFDIVNDHTLKASIKILNSRLEENKITLLNIDGSNVDPKNDRSAMLYEFSILENNKIFRKGNAYKFSPKDAKASSNPIEWAGYRTHYHALIVKPDFETKGYESEVVTEKSLLVNVKPKAQELGSTYEFTLVVGNQDIGWLKTYHQKFEKIVAFSGFWPIDIVAKAVYYTVPFLHNICRSWGFSIILISLIIYGITYPLTAKSMSSMRKMQTVQPKVAALQKKHKDDPQALNKEMIELYRREGVNPLGGCLPFLLQMPIFMALYQILWRAYYFQGQSFLWIKDLTLPDRLLILPFDLPFLGNELNILPIVMGIVMFIQQTITSKNMVVTDEQQAMQQKMMKYIFPFFIGFIFYKFASGLSLYFTVFYSLSAWAQWKFAQGVPTAVKSK
jgi:YidC/Oxa1 family membrane protein insertase